MSEFRRGVRLGIDVGRARIGVARCDPDGMLAVPVETVPRNEHSLMRLRELIDEYEPIEIVIGLPINLRGDSTASTDDAIAFARQVEESVRKPVRMIDERLSTVTAHSALRSSGRSQRGSRSIVDQIAAVVLLQHAIDIEKSTGKPAGTLLEPDEDSRAHD
ncbi:Holliday junction resolvase RuvX [Microbacterium sp. YY-01]|uniref:Holliday junction resolvase RuvX n=1 Tax=Microbacterium sp. YY-01 TaxID=3421634 RepID=UPI003D17AF31